MYPRVTRAMPYFGVVGSVELLPPVENGFGHPRGLTDTNGREYAGRPMLWDVLVHKSSVS